MIEVPTPRDTVNDQSVIVTVVRVASGSLVQKGDIVVEVETSKTTIEVPAPEAGIVTHELEVGQEIEVGANLYFIDDGGMAPRPQTAPVEINIDSSAKFSKAAYARAIELGIDPGSYTQGWVTVEQLETAAGVPEVHNLLKGNHHATTSTIAIRISVSGERVTQAPFLFRNSISDLLLFEAAKLLHLYPELNGCYLGPKSWAKFSTVNFGVSFDTGGNLKVLTIADASKRTLSGIQEELQELLYLYESGKNIPGHLLSSSTVTLSDLSTQDTSFMLPLINGNQSLNLGVVLHQPRMFEIFASFDHRLSEGMRVAKFLADLKDRISSYYRSNGGARTLKCYVCEKTLDEELRVGNRGLLKVAVSPSEEAFFCRNCFEGY